MTSLINNVYEIGLESNFTVCFGDFSGPLNTLLDLILKKKKNIYDIKVKDIIDDFVKYIKTNKENILEELSSFLYIASILLNLKSKSLIPSNNSEKNEESLNENQNLIKLREQEYKIFKGVSDFLSDLIEKESIYFVREAPIEDKFLEFLPDAFRNIKLVELNKIASKLLTSKEEKSNILELYNNKINKTIFQEINRIKEALQIKNSLTFKEITDGYLDVLDIVISFLSILELYKSEIIDIEQFEVFGDILIKKLDNKQV